MAVDLGPKLGFLINANIGEAYYDQFRPFLNAFDVLVQPRVTSVGTNTPPSTPANGDTYVVGTSPTGAWTGQQNAIAVWSTEVTTTGTDTKVPAWVFFPAQLGMQAWNLASAQLTVFTASGWRNLLLNVAQLDLEQQWSAIQVFEGVISNSDVVIEAATAATVGANKNSPDVQFQGNYWNGTASAVDGWSIGINYDAATNPTSQLLIKHNSSGTPSGGVVVFQDGVNFESAIGILGGIIVLGGVNQSVVDTQVSNYSGVGTGVFQPNQNSPSFMVGGGYYNGTNFQPDSWFMENALGTGAAPTSTLTLSHSGSSGVAQFHVPNLYLDSATTAGTATAGSATLPSNPLGFLSTTINGTAVKIPYYAA